MSEYASPTNTNNPILNPVVYFRVSAFALTAVGILGVVLGLMDSTDLLSGIGLTLTWPHTVLHFILAAAAFLFGFGNLAGRAVKMFAIIFGVVYGGLGVLGFFLPDPLGTSAALTLQLGWGINVVHILLGAWALVSGLASRFD